MPTQVEESQISALGSGLQRIRKSKLINNPQIKDLCRAIEQHHNSVRLSHLTGQAQDIRVKAEQDTNFYYILVRMIQEVLNSRSGEEISKVQLIHGWYMGNKHVLHTGPKFGKHKSKGGSRPPGVNLESSFEQMLQELSTGSKDSQGSRRQSFEILPRGDLLQDNDPLEPKQKGSSTRKCVIESEPTNQIQVRFLMPEADVPPPQLLPKRKPQPLSHLYNPHARTSLAGPEEGAVDDPPTTTGDSDRAHSAALAHDMHSPVKIRVNSADAARKQPNSSEKWRLFQQEQSHGQDVLNRLQHVGRTGTPGGVRFAAHACALAPENYTHDVLNHYLSAPGSPSPGRETPSSEARMLTRQPLEEFYDLADTMRADRGPKYPSYQRAKSAPLRGRITQGDPPTTRPTTAVPRSSGVGVGDTITESSPSLEVEPTLKLDTVVSLIDTVTDEMQFFKEKVAPEPRSGYRQPVVDLDVYERPLTAASGARGRPSSPAGSQSLGPSSVAEAIDWRGKVSPQAPEQSRASSATFRSHSYVQKLAEHEGSLRSAGSTRAGSRPKTAPADPKARWPRQYEGAKQDGSEANGASVRDLLTVQHFKTARSNQSRSRFRYDFFMDKRPRSRKAGEPPNMEFVSFITPTRGLGADRRRDAEMAGGRYDAFSRLDAMPTEAAPPALVLGGESDSMAGSVGVRSLQDPDQDFEQDIGSEADTHSETDNMGDFDEQTTPESPSLHQDSAHVVTAAIEDSRQLIGEIAELVGALPRDDAADGDWPGYHEETPDGALSVPPVEPGGGGERRAPAIGGGLLPVEPGGGVERRAPTVGGGLLPVEPGGGVERRAPAVGGGLMPPPPPSHTLSCTPDAEQQEVDLAPYLNQISIDFAPGQRSVGGLQKQRVNHSARMRGASSRVLDGNRLQGSQVDADLHIAGVSGVRGVGRDQKETQGQGQRRLRSAGGAPRRAVSTSRRSMMERQREMLNRAPIRATPTPPSIPGRPGVQAYSSELEMHARKDRSPRNFLQRVARLRQTNDSGKQDNPLPVTDNPEALTSMLTVIRFQQREAPVALTTASPQNVVGPPGSPVDSGNSMTRSDVSNKPRRISSGRSSGAKDAASAESYLTSGRPIADYLEHVDPVQYEVAVGRLKEAKAAVDIQRYFRGYVSRNYYRILLGERREQLENQRHAAVEIQRRYRGHLARKRGIARRDVDSESLAWAKRYKSDLKQREAERETKADVVKKTNAKNQAAADARRDVIGPHVQVYAPFHPKKEGFSMKVLNQAATIIQRFARGWLVRSHLTALKRKAKLTTGSWPRLVSQYKALLRRIQTRLGVDKVCLPFSFSIIQDYMDTRRKYENVFDKKAFGGELELDDVMAYFKELDLYPSSSEVEEVMDAILKGQPQKGRGLSKTQVMELTFQIYCPRGSGLEGHRQSSWMSPIIDGQEALKLRGTDNVEATDFKTCWNLVAASRKERHQSEERQRRQQQELEWQALHGNQSGVSPGNQSGVSPGTQSGRPSQRALAAAGSEGGRADDESAIVGVNGENRSPIGGAAVCPRETTASRGDDVTEEVTAGGKTVRFCDEE